MTELTLDQNKALSNFAEKIRQESKVEEQPPVVEATTQEIEVEQPPKETPKTEEPKVEPVKQEEAVEQPKSWDNDEEVEQKETPKSSYDFGKLGSALELGEVKDESELISKISEIKTKAKQLEEKPFEGIPDDLKSFIEVARTSGEEDARNYLANQLIDYTKVDPLQLFEDEFYRDAAKNPRYVKDGQIDWDAVDAAYDAIPDTLKEFQGKQIQYAKHQTQLQKRQEITAKAQARVEQAEKALSQASRNLNEILPFDKYGIKFEPKHSSQIYEGVTSSKLTKKHLGVSYESLVKNGADMKAVTATIAKAEYAEQMLKFKSNNSKAEAGKALLDKVQNAVIKSPGATVQPESEAAKTKTPAQLMAEYKQKLNQQGRL